MQPLTGMIRTSINNAETQFDRMTYISNNFANYNTTGYKAVRFEQMLNADGYLTGTVRTNYDQGSVRITGNPYDVALKGPGFVPVTSSEGEVQYTRDGSFKVGKNGYLLTNDDWMVGEGIKIPANAYKISIKNDGSVTCMNKCGDSEVKIGTIPLVQFQNSEGLVQGDANKLKATNDSGKVSLVKKPDCFAQYSVECANVNVYDSVSDMLRLNASMIASMRMAKICDDMYNKSINLRES